MANQCILQVVPSRRRHWLVPALLGTLFIGFSRMLGDRNAHGDSPLLQVARIEALTEGSIRPKYRIFDSGIKQNIHASVKGGHFEPKCERG